MTSIHSLLSLMLIMAMMTCARAANDKPPQPETIAHRIGGLSSPDRVDDLRRVMADVEGVKLLSVSFDLAEATFSYDPKKVSSERLNQMLGAAALGIKPPMKVAREKLVAVTVEVIGLDCKGCSLGACNVVSKVDGVEQATANFKEGKVMVLIDPARTSKTAVADALKKAGVELKAAP
jgi:copper chaperone CopZ